MTCSFVNFRRYLISNRPSHTYAFDFAGVFIVVTVVWFGLSFNYFILSLYASINGH